MAKYNVRFSCGHTETIELFGKVRERERKIAYYEECGCCSACYREKQRLEMEAKAKKEGLECVEMHYGDYKRDYADAKTVPGSYNGETKTIKVWIKKK